MFREQYKGAFNEIKADRSQIDKIFELAEKKPEKKAKIIPFRQVGTLAAAIAVVLVVSMYPNFSNFLISDENTIEPKGVVQPQVVNVLDDTAITGAVSANSGEEASELKKKTTENKIVADEKTESKVTATKENIEKSDSKKIVNAKFEDKSSNGRYVISNQIESEKANESTVVSVQIGTEKNAITSSASVVEENIAPALTTNDTDKATEVQSAETTTDASVEATQDVATPAMLNEIVEQESAKVMRASGGGSGAAASSLIFAEFPDFGEDKSVAVYAYRENAGISEKIESGAADMGGYKLVTISDDAECRIAYAEKDGVLYQFTATNLTVEEFDKLIGSYL